MATMNLTMAVRNHGHSPWTGRDEQYKRHTGSYSLEYTPGGDRACFCRFPEPGVVRQKNPACAGSFLSGL